VVGRHRRHAAPIVDAGADQLRQPFGPQVGRRLNVHCRPENDAGYGDGPQVIVQRRLRRVSHARTGLGAEVLDDDFLNVTVAFVDVADRQQGLDAFQPRLADADQEPGGERHTGTPRGFDGGEAHGGRLVRRPEVRAAAVG
jgi:hypothetical protein